MSPQALRRLLEKRDHYHGRQGVDHKYESETIRETFVEKNALEGLTAGVTRGKVIFDTSEEIIYEPKITN